MSDNFTELKHLFEKQVAAAEQIVSKKEELFLIGYDKKQFSIGIALAKLLDGYSVTTAKGALKEAASMIEYSQTINAEEIQSALSSWTD